MSHLRNILDGMTAAFIFGAADVRPYVLNRSGFRSDTEKLRRDVRRVGKDLEQAAKRHGKPLHSGTR